MTIKKVSAFAKDFNKSYDAKIPWLNCSYYSAVSSIRTGLKPVIVFLCAGSEILSVLGIETALVDIEIALVSVK